MSTNHEYWKDIVVDGDVVSMPVMAYLKLTSDLAFEVLDFGMAVQKEGVSCQQARELLVDLYLKGLHIEDVSD